MRYPVAVSVNLFCLLSICCSLSHSCYWSFFVYSLANHKYFTLNIFLLFENFCLRICINKGIKIQILVIISSKENIYREARLVLFSFEVIYIKTRYSRNEARTGKSTLNPTW